MKGAKMVFSWWVDKNTMAYLNVEYCSTLKRNSLSSYEDSHKNIKCTLISERSHFDKATYYESNYITFCNSEKYRDNPRPVIPGDWKWIGMSRRRWRILSTMDMNTYHCTSVQTYWYTTPTMNSEVSYGCWAVIMCQCRLSCSKRTIWVGDIGNRWGSLCVEAEGK